MPGAKAPEPEYIAARRVLLDAFEALGAHRKAVVLVGAQAIYLQVGEGDLAVSPYTTDGDLAIDPRELEDEPELASTLKSAGFELTVLARGACAKPRSTFSCRHRSVVRGDVALDSGFTGQSSRERPRAWKQRLSITRSSA
jgi:hypothetical protein